MSSAAWVRKLFGRPSPLANRPVGFRRAPGRLHLEALETRWVPASFVVRSIGDDPSDANSIRYAITHLEAGPNDITFAPFLAGQTIALTTSNGGELAVTQDVAITGPGADLLTISGSNASRVFNIAAGVTASITGITITSGLASNGLGGAIFNAGNLTVTASAITGSVAQGQNGSSGEGGGGGGAAAGGAVFNSGNFTLNASTVSGNQAIGGNGARGGFSYLGGNGGGPNGGAGSPSGSNAAGAAGGLYSGGGGGNNPGGTAGGAGGFGGGGGGGGDPGSGSGGPGGFGAGSGGGGDNGIGGGGGGGGGAAMGGAVFNADGGTVVITNSTIAENSATGGDGGGAGGGTARGGNGGSGFGAALFSNGGSVTITSSTLAFNSATRGAGVSNGGAQAGGVFSNAGTITLKSTIVGKNRSTTNHADVVGAFADGGYNFIADASGTTDFTAVTTITGADPLLNPLGNYGGSTRTISLRSGSLAFQNGDPTTGLTTDQRGAQRGPAGLNAGAAPDIGAWEGSSSFLVTAVPIDSNIPGTLRGALSWANASVNPLLTNATPNVIRFDTAGTFAIPQTIALDIVGDATIGASALGVTGNVVINGPTGAGQSVTIGRDATAGDLRLFFVAPSGNLALNNLTLSGGVARGGDGGAGGGGAAGLGGAIYNQGSLTLQASTLSGNTAAGGDGRPGDGGQVGGGGGGGLGGSGADGVALGAGGDGGGPNTGTGGRVAANGAAGGNGGGGGGGGFSGGAGGNGGFGGGGGARGFNGGAGGNGGFGGGGGVGSSAGTGGFGGGNRAASGGGGAGFGGAVFNDAGTLAIVNSTLAGNTAAGGSGGNTGKGFGGAVFNRNGTVTATNATIANNTAERGGVFNLGDAGAGRVTLVNTILAGSLNSATDYDSQTINAGTATTGGSNNLIQLNAATGGYSGAATQSGVNPLFAVAGLANNSGPTQTIALQAGSPAVDAGSNAAITAPPFAGPPYVDQRGLTRIAGTAVDLGAFETQLALAQPAAPVTAVEGASSNIPLGSFSDLTPGTSSWTVSVNWGDGSPATSFTVTTQGSLGTRPHTYANPGPFTVSVSVTGSLGNAGRTTFGVDVADPPVQATGGFTLSTTEGSASFLQILAAFTDPGGPESLSEYSASIDWGDGTPSSAGVIVDFGSNNYGVQGDHTYQDDGTYPVAVTIGHDASAPQTVTSRAVVADPPVLATGGFTFTAVEGAFSQNQVVATFTDPGGPEAIGDYAASIDWGDGTAPTAGSIAFNGSSYDVSGTHGYQTNGTFTIAVTVSHHATTPRLAVSTANVDDPALAAAGGLLFTSVEGSASPVQPVARFVDPGGPEAVGEYTASIDWGDGATTPGTIVPGSGIYSVTGSHAYQNEGAYTITVTVGHHATALQTVTSSATVIDPNVIATGGFAVLAKQSIASELHTVATFTDPGGPELVTDYTAQINWGDGANTPGSITDNNGTFTVSGAHAYSQEGQFPIAVTIVHHATTPQLVRSAAFVSNSPLQAGGGFTIDAVEGSLTTAQTVATFVDPSGAEPVGNYGATIDWGDGTAPTPGTITFANGTFTVTGAHAFATAGTLTVVVTITHNGTDAVFVADTANVVDPAVSAAGGFTFTAVEGIASTTQTLAAFTDPGGPDATTEYTAAIAWGDGTTSPGAIILTGSTFLVTGSHQYANNGTYPIDVTIGHHLTTPQVVGSTARVSGQSLLVTGGVTIAASEGTPLVVQTLATFIDPHGSDPVNTYSALIDWGDGTTPTAGGIAFANGAFTVSAGHTYVNEGTYPVSVTVAHAGVSQSVTDTAVVANADTLVGTAETATPLRGKAYSGVVAEFTNAGYPDHGASAFAATIDWGDGTAPSAGTITNNAVTLAVEGDHAYSRTGVFPITVTLVNISPGTTTATAIGSARVSAPIVVIGAMTGGSEVREIDAETSELIRTFVPYGAGFTGGITVAQGDVNGDGFADVITGAGFGGASHVKVFDGLTGREIMSFFAYDPTFRNGVYVAAGDVNGDGYADIITGAGFTGAPHVKVFDGRTLQQVDSFFAYDSSFRNGVYVSSADVNGDGRADIITGAGPGGGPHVKVFDAKSVTTLKSFFAYSADFTGGVFVAGGDVDGDGFGDIITGAGSGGSGHVQVFSGKTGAVIRSFLAFPGESRNGVTVAASDSLGTGLAALVIGATSGEPGTVMIVDSSDLTGHDLFSTFDDGFLDGVFVG